ncbi:Putative mycotoxin biosynthesis protein UstYa [Colletotrichum destructivum]|uniref:Mycotoxin biosynthesis protein UstYa n=1 Tax=Colletotrichum destructivum TaxID=34406 RepID=A0AAX4ILH9_9PEZI|nr:Putative mycotoxin biosynthesis protein UstYa [Colletotrichum destructivum]
MAYAMMEKSPRSSLSSLSSEKATAEPEIEDLLEHKAGSGRIRWSPRLSITLSFSVLLNAALIAALAILLRGRHGPSRPPWVPPERVDKHIFLSQPIFGQGPNDTTEDRWAMLMPKGNGWINVTVDDGELPYMPGLDRSLPEQKARLSVFHQLHCLYMARDAFIHARDGHVERVNVAHLSECWDYLRQGIMCAGDTTLEWKQANASGSEFWGYQHNCKDYALLFMFAEQYRATEDHSLRGEY